MIIIGNTIISESIYNVCFSCDLPKCHGACCVEGDAGAPLEMEEISILEDALELIKPYMTPEGTEVIEKVGVFDYDANGHYVTPLVKDRECSFVFFENGIVRCAIEKAYEKKKLDFRKPLSCHLYPIRRSQLLDNEILNYHSWSICSDALIKGKKEKNYLYRFLKEPLIRKYGRNWYNKLIKAINNILNHTD
jgi:hypothetical protein